MTEVAIHPDAVSARPEVIEHPVRRALRQTRVVVGGGMLLLIFGACILTLPWTLRANSPISYDAQYTFPSLEPAKPWPINLWFGADHLGRPMLGRCLVGGTISLAVGAAAAVISIVLGVSVGLFAGYRGGWIDALLMRSVDIFYGLPYVLLIILFKVAFERPIDTFLYNAGLTQSSSIVSNLVVLFLAIGLVSWLTMARVVRGQVLSLRGQPFIEAARAMGLPERRIFFKHLLPNLVGPITVYATLTVPQAILQESFLSFLGIGVNAPMATWGSLAADGLAPALNPIVSRWWLLLFPCVLLALTLLSLNFLGDGLRDLFDPKRDAAKI
jgi:ABC-type dipeptide/oligopeptide/nickel transport system permease subunit